MGFKAFINLNAHFSENLFNYLLFVYFFRYLQIPLNHRYSIMENFSQNSRLRTFVDRWPQDKILIQTGNCFFDVDVT